jgi:hypothetical protein
VADDKTENAGDQQDHAQDFRSAHLLPPAAREANPHALCGTTVNLRLPRPQGQTGKIFPSGASDSVGRFRFTAGPPLSPPRWNRPDRRREARVRRWIDGLVSHLRACRILAEEVVTLPVSRRANRSRNESSAAVRADVGEDGVDAVCTKRALVAADSRFGRVRRQRRGAVFAGGSELEHDRELDGGIIGGTR